MLFLPLSQSSDFLIFYFFILSDFDIETDLAVGMQARSDLSHIDGFPAMTAVNWFF